LPQGMASRHSSAPEPAARCLGATVERHIETRGELVAEFTEIESGRHHTNRPQLLALLSECRKRRATAGDHQARSARAQRRVYFRADGNGADFVCCDNPNASPLLLHMLARVCRARTVANLRTHEDRSSCREGVRHTTRESARCRGRPARQGAKGNMRPEPEVLNLIASLAGQGRGLRAIARELNWLKSARHAATSGMGKPRRRSLRSSIPRNASFETCYCLMEESLR
jgi:hypothetical protein